MNQWLDFFKAQLRNPSKGDWTEIVKKDLVDFEIFESFDQIAKLSTNVFKKKAATACKKYAFQKLINDKNSADKSKGRNLTYSKFKTMNYLISGQLSPQEAKLMFKLRSRMLNVKGNFKNKYLNNDTFLQCQKCLSGILESQEHIIDCDIFETKPDINYNDIFCDDMQKVKTALTEFQKAWNEWQEN